MDIKLLTKYSVATFSLIIVIVPFFSACSTDSKVDAKNETTKIEKNVSFPEEKSFVPGGWEVIIREVGDLNKDGLNDIVLVIENTDPKNFKTNEKLGNDTLNLNPRNLLILFQQKEGGFVLGVKNTSNFIPRPHDEDSPCLDDPLLNNGGIELSNGTMKITFNYWLSCGSFFVSTKTFTFRYQNEGFELIGYDQSEYSRASGEETSESINFSTGKISTTTGGNVFEDNESNPKTKWSTITKKTLLKLDDCNEETAFSFRQ